MPSSDSSRDVVLERLAAEFVERHRQGEHPPLSEYTDRHPDLAADIRDLFPALVQIEKLKPAADATGAFEPATVSSDGVRPERLGDYRILREIGHGGMGVVYEAEQESLGRHVALKVLPSSALLNATYLERFRREAKAAARLHHTNIVPVFGTGECDGVPYYAMQFIRGEGLDKVLADVRRMRRQAGEAAPGTVLSEGSIAHSLLTGQFAVPAPDAPGGPVVPPETPPTSGLSVGGPEAEYCRGVARVGVQVAEALAYAHRQGILHRDIKPSNLLLDQQGTVWVSDFGLAKAEGTDELTQTGDIVGTIRFMAPERFDGRSLPQSDVYALGVTLYELLTLRPAFDDTNKAKLIDKVAHEAPLPPRNLDPHIPRDLETVVLKCLAKDPAQRYASAEALADDLRRFLADRPIKARRSTMAEQVWRWCRRNPAGAGLTGVSVLAALALVGLGVGLRFNAQLQTALQGEAEQRQKAEQYQYYHHLARAGAAWRDGNLAGVEDLLDACPPEARHWEWYFLKQQCHTDLLTVPNDFRGGFNRVTLSPDGKLLATVSRTVDLRDSATGAVVHSLPGDGVAAFSPDGKWLASSNRGENIIGRDKTVRLWDIATGQRIQSFQGHLDVIHGLMFSRDGKRLAAFGNGKGVVTVWDTTTGKALFITNRPDPAFREPASVNPGAVDLAAFSPDGERLVLAGRDRTAKICNATSGQVEHTLRGHTREVWECVFSPDGRWLASASFDGTVKVWDTQTGQEVRTLGGHKGPVWGVAYSPDGARLASASVDGTVRLWDAQTGRTLRTYQGHTNSVAAVAWHPDGSRLASTSTDGTVKVWDATADPEARIFRVHDNSVIELRYSPDGTRLASTSFDGTVKVWDAKTGRVIYTLTDPAGGWPPSIAFNSDGTRVASGHADGSVRIWDATTGREERRLPVQPGFKVGPLSFSPDDQRLACGSYTEKKVRVWDVTTDPPLLTFKIDGQGIAKFSPDGSQLVTDGDGRTMKVWHAKTGAWLRDLPGHTIAVRDIAFNHDGTRLASAGGFDGTARVWDTTTGDEVLNLKGHTFLVRGVAFTPDGKRLASVTTDGIVKLWDTATGQEVFALRADTDEWPTLAFSPDGGHLALSCANGIVKIWDGRPR